MSASDLLCDASESTCLHYLHVNYLFMKNLYIYEMVQVRRGRDTDQEVLGVPHLDDKTLFARDGDYAMLLVQAVDFYLNSPSRSSIFLPQTFYISGRQLLRLFHQLCNRVNNSRVSKQEEPFLFRAFWALRWSI